MRFYNALFSLVFFLFLFSCSSDNTTNDPDENPVGMPSSEAYLTVNVDADFNTAETDNWIFVHDSAGLLLGTQSYESGDVLVFETETFDAITDEIIITDFKSSTDSGNTSTVLSSYPEINKGSTWNFKAPPERPSGQPRGANLGEFTIRVNNVPGIIDYTISSNLGNMGSSASIGSTSLETTFFVFENGERHLLTIIDENNDLKYAFIDNLPDGGFLFLDYTVFTEFDEDLSISLPPGGEYFSTIQAFPEGQELRLGAGFALNFILPATSQNIVRPFSLGYLDAFSQNSTIFSYTTDDYFYAYQKFGEKSDGIAVPENVNLTIVDESISNFDFSATIPFIRRKSEWSTSTGERDVDLIQTRWIIESSNAEKLPGITLPVEILEAYPEINLESLQYDVTRIYTGFESYNESIARRFGMTTAGPALISTEEYVFSN